MQEKASLHLEDGLRFTAATGSGFTIALDSSSDGAAASAPSPMETVLAALGGCTAMDVISVLRKMRQDVTAYDVSLVGDRAEGHPRTYTEILMTHSFSGPHIGESNVRRAIELSMTRYCPVFAMLSPGVRIRELYEIVSGAETIVGEVTVEIGEGGASNAP